MTGDEVLDAAVTESLQRDERLRSGNRRRLRIGLSCAAVAGLVLVGDFVRQADARAESAAGTKTMAKKRKPPRHSGWGQIIPWIISFVSVVALIVVILVTT